MAISAEFKSKFAAFHQQEWCLQISDKFSKGTKNSKKKPKQLNKKYSFLVPSMVSAISLTSNLDVIVRRQEIVRKKVLSLVCVQDCSS